MMYKISDNQFINLSNVSHFKYEENNLRVIAVYNYSIKSAAITTPKGNMKVISDYDYISFKTKADLDAFWNELSKIGEENKSFRVIDHKGYKIIINLDCVISIKIKSKYIIVNFNNSITFYTKDGNDEQLTSQFVYIDTETDEDVKKILSILV